MNILITGAAGFIGSHMTYRLWKKGYHLILVDNFSYGHIENLVFDDHDFSEEVIRMDIRDKEGINYLMQNNKIDYIYNFAGIAALPECQAEPVEAIDVNVNGLVNILENARIYGVKKIIQASTNAIYENEKRFPTDENISELPTLIYPNTKYMAERFAESYCNTYGMSVSCLRFSNVYGPHVDCLRKQPPFVAYMIRELYYDRTPVFFSNGEQKRDYIYVDDLINLALAVLDSTGFDVVNVSGNECYSVNEMYQIAQEIMKKSIPASYAKDNQYWEKYGLYRGKYTIKQEILNHEINKYSLCDNSYAKNKYKWRPCVTMREGLKKMIEAQSVFLSQLGKKI